MRRRSGRSGARAGRLLWFAALWAAGVLVVVAAAYGLRYLAGL